LGTPFITTVNDVRDSQIGNNKQFFVNNRVLALHTGVQFYAFNWLYTGKFSYSENMGTYDNGTELYRSVGGKIRSPANYGAFKKVHQYSTYFEGIRALKNGYSVGYDLAYDHGGLLYNSFGIILKVSKAFM
jgi:hypothetical protein